MAKVNKWLKPKNLEQITAWASDRGKAIPDIARLMDISPSTLHNWLNTYPLIKEAFEEGRKVVDDHAENQFMKMCFGYNVTVEKPKKVRRWKLDKNGKRIEEFEEYVQVPEEIHIPPCWPALQTYIFNRMPDKYRPINAVLPPGNEDEEITGVVEMPMIEEAEAGEIADAEIVEN